MADQFRMEWYLAPQTLIRKSTVHFLEPSPGNSGPEAMVNRLVLRMPPEHAMAEAGKARYPVSMRTQDRHSLSTSLKTSALICSLAISAYWITRPDPIRSLRQYRATFLAYYWAGWAVSRGYSPSDANRLHAELTRADDPDVVAAGLGTFLDQWVYPPTSAWFFAPYALFDEYGAQVLHYLVVGMSAMIFIALCGYLSGSPVRGTLFFAVWSALLLRQVWIESQVTATLSCLLACSLICLRNGEDKMSGRLMGVATCIKPVELAWWLPLVWNRPRAIAGLLSPICALSGISILLYGFEPWSQWLVEMKALSSGHAGRLPHLHYLLGLGACFAYTVGMTKPDLPLDLTSSDPTMKHAD